MQGLWRISGRIGGKQVSVLGFGKMPGRADPIIRKFFRALHGFAFGEICDGVIALNSDSPEKARIDGILTDCWAA